MRIAPALRHCLCFVSLFLCLVTVPANAGWNHDPYMPMPVCTATGMQFSSATCTDGAGGLFVVWTDYRNAGIADLYGQHLDANGNALWPPNGIPLCNAVNDQTVPAVCSDGAGGFFAAWRDKRGGLGVQDVYAERFTSTGAAAPGWLANGLLLSVAAVNVDDQNPVIAADGAGGAFVAWTAIYNGSDGDPHLQHVTAAGAKWGGIVDASNSTQPAGLASLVVSGGNAFIVYLDRRSGTQYDVYFQGAQPDGTLLFAVGGVQVTNTTGVNESDSFLAPDASGGVWVCWDDSGFIYAHRFSAGVDVAGGSYATAAGSRYLYAVPSDGAGGLYLLWSDHRTVVFGSDFYALHVNGNGTVGSGWDVNGTLVAGNVQSLAIFATNDEQKGLLVQWSGNDAEYMQHMKPDGSLWPGWSFGGRAIGPSSYLASIMSDGAQGAFSTMDAAFGTEFDVYAQHVERFSQLGSPAPAIVSARDVRNDQGGNLKVSWNGSYLDSAPDFVVTAYDVWRSVPAATAMAALRGGATLLAADAAPAAGVTRGRVFAPDAASAYYWEYVARQTANGGGPYSYVVPTLGDSIGGSNPYTVVKVRALPTYGSTYWESAPDSGYTVDNLPPVAPAPFAATFTKGVGAALTWGPNAEADLAGYRLYRGTTPGFVPGPGNRISQLSLTNFTDAGAVPSYYKLSAYDIHGNESGFVTILPTGTAGVDGTPVPREVFLARATPNPARSGTLLRFGLPAAARVELALYDAAGRLVRSLAHGELAAGEHATRWDGLDDAGAPVASGLLFVRLEVGERTWVERVVVVH